MPEPLPPLPDDIDLRARDYEGLRRVMLEDLAARQPARTAWSPADEEVVLVEAFATVLDELSDMADRSHAEMFLSSARRPASVRWLLETIGVDAGRDALAAGDLAVSEADLEALDEAEAEEVRAGYLYLQWIQRPDQMAAAREAGPGRLHDQQRMVTVPDHSARIQEHPLVARASARAGWHGSWPRVQVAVVLEPPIDGLDATLPELPDGLRAAVDEAHEALGLQPIPWSAPSLTARTVLRPYVDRLRMAGTEVTLADVIRVPVRISLSVELSRDYWRTEVEHALRARLGSGPGGFFRPGYLQIGEDLHSSDLLEVAASVEGVVGVSVNRFKQRGDRFPDRSDEGVIVIDELEVPVLGRDDSGLSLFLHGGMVG
jgi:hypothetical protein